MVNMRFGMFNHFSLGTFTGEEWAAPNQDPAKFAPPTVDCAQWAAAAAAAKMSYGLLTTKHHDGFALWPSAYGTQNVANSAYKHDVVKAYCDAFRPAGLRVGFCCRQRSRSASPPGGLIARRVRRRGLPPRHPGTEKSAPTRPARHGTAGGPPRSPNVRGRQPSRRRISGRPAGRRGSRPRNALSSKRVDVAAVHGRPQLIQGVSPCSRTIRTIRPHSPALLASGVLLRDFPSVSFLRTDSME